MVHKKKIIVFTIALALIIATAGSYAYFTGHKDGAHVFTVGSISISLTETAWEGAADLVPNAETAKNPAIVNNGDRDAYAFIKVEVPTASISSKKGSSAAGTATRTQLFQLNKTKGSEAAQLWSETDTYNTDAWKLISTENKTDSNVYVFAYTGGSSSSDCVKLASSSTTPELFQSITFANALSDQGTEGKDYDIIVTGYGIQAEGLDSSAATSVWATVQSEL